MENTPRHAEDGVGVRAEKGSSRQRLADQQKLVDHTDRNRCSTREDLHDDEQDLGYGGQVMVCGRVGETAVAQERADDKPSRAEPLLHPLGSNTDSDSADAASGD